MRRLLFLLALLPVLAFGHPDDPDNGYPAGHNPRHKFTADLTRVTGIESPAQGWPVVRLISRGVGGGPLILDQGFGRPRTLPVSGSTVTATLLASEEYTRAQEYVLVVGTTQYPFTMPDEPTSFAATQVPVGETGPCTVSKTEPPKSPQSPSPGDLWCQPPDPDASPPRTAYQFWYRADNDWRQVSVKDYARLGGREIALSDTDFAGPVRGLRQGIDSRL